MSVECLLSNWIGKRALDSMQQIDACLSSASFEFGQRKEHSTTWDCLMHVERFLSIWNRALDDIQNASAGLAYSVSRHVHNILPSAIMLLLQLHVCQSAASRHSAVRPLGGRAEFAPLPPANFQDILCCLVEFRRCCPPSSPVVYLVYLIEVLTGQSDP